MPLLSWALLFAGQGFVTQPDRGKAAIQLLVVMNKMTISSKEELISVLEGVLQV